MTEYTTVFVSGEVYWASIFNPRMNYEQTGKEWSLDFVPDDTTFLKEHRLLDRLKEPREPITGEYLRLRKPELDKDGKPNEPIRVYDADDKAWDPSVAVGNKSKVDVKLTIADFGKGKKKAIWVKAIRVTDHVPYQSNEFAGMGKGEPENNKSKPKADKKDTFKKDFGIEDDSDLNDEVPF